MSQLGPYELNTIVTGDARELAEAIPDNSVDIIFTDPVYQNIEDYEWLARTAARVLKDEGHLLAWQGTAHLPATFKAMDCLEYRWVLSMSHSNSCIGNLIWMNNLYSHWTPLLWFSKTATKPYKKIRDLKDVPLLSGVTENHAWHKSIQGLDYYLQAFTQPNDIVADFFTGGGTVPAVCKMLGRNYWACEIDPSTAARARERVLLTQAPLFVMKPEQAILFTEATP